MAYTKGNYNSAKVIEIESIKYLGCVAQLVITEGGFVTSKEAQESGAVSTAKKALEAYHSGAEFGSQAEKLANRAAEWAKTLTPKSTLNDSFEWNMRACVAAGKTTEKYAGTLAYVIPAYLKAAQKETEKAANATKGQYVGQVGEKVTVEVVIKGVKVISTKFGYSYLYKMEDKAGNKLTWFASSDKFEAGQVVNLTGTVKSQEIDSYTGFPTTQLTKCKEAPAVLNFGEAL